MDTSEIRRISKWFQFILLVLSLVKQAFDAVPSMASRMGFFGKRRKR